ncbi:NAD(P)-dependent dehydrogenase (short-subunit alcohol dehydrogenase family) [Rhodopirellula rubra]|uniref:NAD(P)-dependent dehydrogenase (Short-subunit alcohol dehydrogenase family) n=1 Tax=Aporhodopirellula rubra TaxID=980271 RepID=A0A7W5H6Q1_9BACT|nr:SDR family oxidoreductase [Aporhodopirellula rubra]MBB3207096.1 NAD(P)-dependent dehydrogenase (short-subunit alcohol dehydrogenase family) [Aporhodopirellula rubra]
MDIRLHNKVAIVTGAAGGIGLATVLQFLESGIAGVIAVDIAEHCPPKLQSHCDGETGRVTYIQGDVARTQTAERFTSAAMQRFGKIDLLFNNAGTSAVKPIHEHSEDEWDRIMDTNVKALFQAARQVIPVMIRQGNGLILNSGSISGLVGIRGQGAYAASKGAVHQITRQMAIEYAGQGIRVNTLALGTVATPILEESARQTKDPAGFIDELRNQHPIGRIATAEEVGKFVTFLASDSATFFTGATLSLDGGFTAW